MSKHSTQENTTDDKVRISKRIMLFFAILAIGMLICIDGFVAILLYPAGILVTLAMVHDISMSEELTLTIGYGIYIILFMSFLISSQRRAIRWVTIAMILVTITNVVGCRHVLNQLSNI